MRVFIRTIFFSFPVAIVLAGCTEPTPPPLPPPKLEQLRDSTSHDYTWEYMVLGGFGSSMSAVAADADDNVWAVGDIDLGYDIPSTPPGRIGNRANAVHITPRGIKMYAIQIKHWSDVGYAALRGVTLHDGDPTFWVGLSRTRLLKDSVDMRFFPDRDGLSPGISYYAPGIDGHVYEYGGKGYLGRFIGPRFTRFEQLPSGTAKTVRSFTQTGPDEFYIGGWNHDSTGGIFHHLRDGGITPIWKETGRRFPITYATAIWSSRERLHAVCPDFIYMQSLAEPAAWDTLYLPSPTPERIIGLPICAAGRADNDVFYAGHYATVLHYNGRSLHFYDEIPKRFPDGCVLYDIAVTDNHVFVVGQHNGYPILLKGTKMAQ
jgi:hypothetical protein